MSQIKKGDLVMVVRGTRCCGVLGHIGRTYTVIGINNSARWRCFYCGSPEAEPLVRGENLGNGYELSCLIRIDPPAHGDSLPTRKDIKEPA